MLTSAKVGKQNGDTRIRKSEPGYLNLSSMTGKFFFPSLTVANISGEIF
jgi:hypothetical protein